jgi:hypothetical protein
MNKLTLKEAVGQTLLATIEIGEGLFLRFPDGVVRLFTNYESYDIYDYTDEGSELDRLHLAESQLIELVKKGFISESQKEAALQERDRVQNEYRERLAKQELEQYERLKLKFEKK